MLWSILAYAKGLRVDTRWLVMHGDEPFFRVAKRIHNLSGRDGPSRRTITAVRARTAA